MKISTHQLFFRAKEIRNSHQHNTAKHKRTEWLQSAFNSIAFGNLNIFSRLIETKNQDLDLQGLDIDTEFQEKFKETILHSLCRNGRILMMEHFLTNHQGDPNQYSQEGITPFHLAVMKSIMGETKDDVELLLTHGADILKPTKNGQDIEKLVRMMDPSLSKGSSQWIVNKYREAQSYESQIILLQILESPAREQPPFTYLTNEDILELLYLL